MGAGERSGRSLVGRIAILPGPVADQIAAGEVVERPASVVKELVENALDAGATTITVDIEHGGRDLIRVGDDGVGMDRDDAVLSIDRHATSKIHRAADLIGISTFGFRGEALASIASVSRFELETAAEQGVGTRLIVRGGRLESVEDAARTRGTTVTVAKLFSTTPARRKYLRSPRSETRASVEALTVLALARLDVSFTLSSDGRARIEAPSVADIGERIAALFGRKLADQLVPVEYNDGYVTVRGFVQRPADAAASGRRAHLFVNGRPVRDPFLVRSAEAGYRATIAPGHRPTVFLAIEVPGDRVDVNVHPAKLEVRFRDRRFIEHAVEQAVREALGVTGASAQLAAGHWSTGSAAAPAVSVPSTRPDLSAPVAHHSLFDEVPPSGDAQTPLAGDLLQLFSTYIVFEAPDGLTIVDQHSAHERVLYEDAMEQLTGRGAAGQRLLLPLTLDLTPEELEAVEAAGELLSAVGYEVEGFGGRSVVLHAVPNPHPRFDARRCFEELVADLARGRFGGWANRLERFAAMYGCRAAIKAGHALEQREMRALLQRLFACRLAPHDVHGRPSMVQLPKHELERRFGRS